MDTLALVTAALVVGGPALFTLDGFELDFTNHLWLVWVQEHAIAHGQLPTFFLSTPTQGVFNPFFAFYGGSLYATAGMLATLLGSHPVVAYLLVIVLAIAGAYGGLLWLARQLGAHSWMAHAPAITFVSSAYYVTNLYGRGDWPEFVATSSIPLLVASGWHLARSGRIEPLPAILFVISVIFFSGSQNATLLWGSIALVTILLCLRAALGSRVAASSRRRLLQLLALAVLAVAVNAWFLLPDVLYVGNTQIARDHIAWNASSWLNTPRVLFNPLRYVPRHQGTPALYLQLPVWPLLWALVVMFVLRRRSALRNLRRAFLAVALVLAGFLAVILVEALYNLLPQTLQAIQLPYRLITFATLAVAGLVLAAVLAVERVGPVSAAVGLGLRRGLRFALAISVGLCLWQLWVPETHGRGSYSDRGDALVSIHETPQSWYQGGGAYADLAGRVVSTAPGRLLLIDPRRIDSDRVSFIATPPPGHTPFATNIIGGQLVALHGLVRLGRTPDGRVVARRLDASDGPVRITIERGGRATKAGWLISALALFSLLSIVAVAVARRMPLSRVSRIAR